MDLRFADGTLLRLGEPDAEPSVSLLPGLGVHRFTVTLTVGTATAAEGCNHLLVGGEVWAEPSAGGPQWIGLLAPVVVPVGPAGAVAGARLSMPVTNDQVLALERARGGQDLRLRVDLRGTLPQSAALPVADGRATLRIASASWDTQVRSLTSGLAAPDPTGC